MTRTSIRIAAATTALVVAAAWAISYYSLAALARAAHVRAALSWVYPRLV